MQMNHWTKLAAVALMFFSITGCAKPTVEVAYRPGIFVEKPDVIVIRPFAPSLAETLIDGDVLPDWVIKGRAVTQSGDDVRAGETASKILAQEMVTAFKARGLPAVAAIDAPDKTQHMVIVTGQFVDVSSGTPSLRPAIGYRAGKGMETRMQITQHNTLIGELKAEDETTDMKQGATGIAGKIADQVVKAYVMRGWLPPPAPK